MKTVLFAAVSSLALISASAPAAEAQTVRWSTAEPALDMLRLTEGHTPEWLSFADSSFRRGVYTLTDVVIDGTDLNEPDTELPDGKTLGEDDGGFDSIHIATLRIENPRLNADGELQVGAFSLDDIVVTDAEEGVTLNLDRFAIDSPNATMAAEIGQALTGLIDDDSDLSWEEYEFGAIEIDGLRLTGTGEDVFDITLDRFAIADYSADSMERFEILGFDMTGEEDDGPVSVRLEEFSIDGLETTSYKDMMAALSDGGDEDAFMSAYMNSITTPYEVLDAMTLTGMSVDAPGIAVVIDDMTMSVDERGSRYVSEFSIGTLSVVPDASHSDGAELAGGLALLGYDQLSLSMASNTIYDERGDQMWTEGDNYILLEDGFRIDFEQDFNGYSAYLEGLSALTEAEYAAGGGMEEKSPLEPIQEALNPLILNGMTIRLEDLSLLERGLAASAQQQGITPEDMRTQAAAMVTVGLLAIPPEVPRSTVTEMSTAANAFITSGGTLVVDLDPDTPLSIGDMLTSIENESFDFSRLGLSVTHEAP